MNFRYFDVNGKQLTENQLRSMHVTTPAMEHIFATVTERVEKIWKLGDGLENRSPEQYN